MLLMWRLKFNFSYNFMPKCFADDTTLIFWSSAVILSLVWSLFHLSNVAALNLPEFATILPIYDGFRFGF